MCLYIHSQRSTLLHSKQRCSSAKRKILRPMASQTLVLPGEVIPSHVLPIPSNPSLALKLGPGLRHTPPSTITSVLAGPLCIDQKKNAIWVENTSGRVLLFPPSHAPHPPPPLFPPRLCLPAIPHANIALSTITSTYLNPMT